MTIAEKTSTKEKTKIKSPILYKVIFFNDDFTPFVFVESILKIIFNKNETDAIEITHRIHSKGKAIVATYPKEIAQTKQAQTIYNARQNNFPLHCEIEPES